MRKQSRFTILITAGPTREAIDPVRYLTNRSSGKMGYALAESALKAGHKVILISGPTALPPPKRAEFYAVTSAANMKKVVLQLSPKADIIIKAAAVADYRPAQVAKQKIKKKSDTLTLKLVKNPDILLALGKIKPAHQVLIGFAAETQSIHKNALKKLHAKNLDAIVVNDVSQKDIGFDSNFNAAQILLANGDKINLPKSSKIKMADRILNVAIKILSLT